MIKMKFSEEDARKLFEACKACPTPTIKDLAFVAHKLNSEVISVGKPMLVFSLKAWLSFIDHMDKPGVIAFTEEELKAADPETGFIGTKGGIDCYIGKLI